VTFFASPKKFTKDTGGNATLSDAFEGAEQRSGCGGL
jgi:hypothetical protein